MSNSQFSCPCHLQAPLFIGISLKLGQYRCLQEAYGTWMGNVYCTPALHTNVIAGRDPEHQLGLPGGGRRPRL